MSASALRVARRIRIARAPEDVFAVVADPTHDPRWCAKVRSVEQVVGSGPGPGARWVVVHRPIPLRPPRRMDHRCLSWDPPHAIAWREDDGTDLIDVAYRLTPHEGGTLFEQRDEAHLGAPSVLRPVVRAGLGRDLGRQLRALKRLLEGEAGVGSGGAAGAG